MVYIPEKIKMNKIFKILIFILAIEILLGYAFYFKDSSLISGHYVSSSLRLIDKVFRSIKPMTEDFNEKIYRRQFRKW